jgi:hypothetical protein
MKMFATRLIVMRRYLNSRLIAGQREAAVITTARPEDIFSLSLPLCSGVIE